MKLLKDTIQNIALEIRTGKTPPTSNVEYFGEEINWYTPSDLDKGKYLGKSRRGITQKAIIDKKAIVFKPNTVLIGAIGDIGKLGVTSNLSSSNQQLTGIYPNPEIIDAQFLFYWLKAHKQILIDKSKSAIVPILNNKDLGQIKISYPENISDQIQIANILSKAETLIEQRKQSIALLDEFLKSTFLEMFGDAKNNEKGFQIKNLTEFYINPKEGTKCGPFGSALKKDEYTESGIQVWTMDNILKSGEFVENGCLFVSEIKHKELERYDARNGDIIISRAGTVGKMCIIKTDKKISVISSNLIRLRLGKYLLPIYFLSLMRYCQSRIIKLKHGNEDSYTHMSTGILDEINFPYPPIELQTQFANIVSKTETLKEQYKNSLQELENLYGSLSQKAFKGELEFAEVKSVVANVISLPALQPVEEKYFLKRKVLATYIINESLNDTNFGDVKFEKILYLSDYFAIKRNLGQKYYQQTAGPYDNAFTIQYFPQVINAKWFNRSKDGKQFVFSAGQQHAKSTSTYNFFSTDELQRVNEIISYFKKYDYEQPEIVSTLYAVWNNRIILQEQITNDLLIDDFYKWDEQKKKYERSRLEKALTWMRNKNFIPDGWGKMIKKAKKTTR